MDWVQLLTLFIGIAGMLYWFRSETKLFESEVRGWREDMHKETKDFHGRLMSLEERRKSKSD